MTLIFELGGLTFEWDSEKAAGNVEKHGVSFYEAATAFFDVDGLLIPDLKHSQSEDRIILIGRSDRRVLTVAHAERGENLRIITARSAEPWERRFYEQRRDAGR